MDKNIFTFEGVNIYRSYWKGKTEADFLKHEGHQDLSTEQLKEAWAAFSASEKPAAAAPATEAKK